ncbi:MAG TPA: hypothetical protein VF950_01925 [Planctomycetota bacterium]
MKKLAALLLIVVSSGCVHHSGGPSHPHGGPPGQMKKAMYRCGDCGATKASGGSCHGKVMILVP